MHANRKDCVSRSRVVALMFLAAAFAMPGAVSADYTNTVDIMTPSGHSYTQTVDIISDDVINNDSNIPDSGNWYKFTMPSWYDSSYVTVFTIDAHGYNDNSGYAIDIWRRWPASNGTPVDSKKVVGFDVNNGTRSFILRTDLIDGSLWYKYKQNNGNWQPAFNDTNIALNNIAVESFDAHAHDTFKIGFACHFTLDKLELHIEQGVPVPEPFTLLFLGACLVGAGVVGKKFRI